MRLRFRFCMCLFSSAHHHHKENNVRIRLEFTQMRDFTVFIKICDRDAVESVNRTLTVALEVPFRDPRSALYECAPDCSFQYGSLLIPVCKPAQKLR